MKGDRLTDVKLKIFEPPRFFEAFLRGRDFREAPDITARICGICPMAYQMSAVHAMERALGLEVTGPLRDLRRIMYYGEWIESHGLHVFLLHLPDFLGYQDAIQIAKENKALVENALKLKKTGNELMARIGGREIHPVNIRVGGFYKVPRRRDLDDLREQLRWAADFAREAVRMTSRLEFPDFEQDYDFVALRPEGEYSLLGGPLVSSSGLSIDASEYERHFREEHVEHSNALHSVKMDGGPYFVGPLARYSLNFDQLAPAAREAAREAGLKPVCRNPFQSIVVRCVEMVHAVEEAARLIDAYEPPDQPALETEPRAGEGWAITEAPRGILYHRYRIDAEGKILEARIVPPTSQNQKTIEQDLWRFIPPRMHLPQDQLTWQCEQAIRNYDPCISCATHFLKLELVRE